VIYAAGSERKRGLVLRGTRPFPAREINPEHRSRGPSLQEALTKNGSTSDYESEWM